MVPLTTAGNAFEARVLAAHLGAEGIVWELRGNVEGPYPIGPVVVLVAEADLAVAREVVRERAELPEAAADATRRPGGTARPGPAGWLVAAAVVLSAALLLGGLLLLDWR